MKATPEQKQLAKATLQDIIDNPQHWDQRFWHCDTTHCYAGFLELRLNGLKPSDEYIDKNTRYIAAKALGLNHSEDCILFRCSNTLKDLKILVKAYCDELTMDDVKEIENIFSSYQLEFIKNRSTNSDVINYIDHLLTVPSPG